MATFAILDPRPTAEAQAANEKVFAGGRVLGVEVTVPALAKRCITNLDPQHTGGDVGTAAIEAALICELPEGVMGFATVKADLDSVGAMVVLYWRQTCPDILARQDVQQRIAAIAAADKSDRGAWQPKPLPRAGDPLDPNPERAALLGLARLVADFRQPLTDRSNIVEQYLQTGGYNGQEGSVAALRAERDEAIAASQAKLDGDGCIAVVESTHRGAMGLGYCLAPVVVAVNPAFQQGPGEPYKKFTVAQFGPGYVELGSVKDELNAIEPGWGGSPTILGSPQGVSSKLTLQQVAEVVRRHLKYDSWCADCGTIGYGVGFYACSECRTLLCASCVDVHQIKGHFVSQ